MKNIEECVEHYDNQLFNTHSMNNVILDNIWGVYNYCYDNPIVITSIIKTFLKTYLLIYIQKEQRAPLQYL